MKLMSLIEEGWSDKYKKSIDCNNPKGFSQKAHCNGKKKRNLSEENLNDLEFTKSISDKHQKEIDYNKEKGLFKDFDISEYKKIDPPKNNSKETKEEIELLSSLPENKEFVEKYDRISKSFKQYSKEKGHDIPKGLIKELIESAAGVIYELKYHFNRPRPQQIADKLDIKMGEMNLKSAKSPSYPSGHSTQSKLVGEVLFDITKDEMYRTIAERISISRNVGRVHYPSDSKMGEKLGVDLYEYWKKGN